MTLGDATNEHDSGGGFRSTPQPFRRDSCVGAKKHRCTSHASTANTPLSRRRPFAINDASVTAAQISAPTTVPDCRRLRDETADVIGRRGPLRSIEWKMHSRRREDEVRSRHAFHRDAAFRAQPLKDCWRAREACVGWRANINTWSDTPTLGRPFTLPHIDNSCKLIMPNMYDEQ